MKYKLFIVLLVFNYFATAQPISAPKNDKPKLIVGIVVDQMRWEYLYKFKQLYSSVGGFNKLLNNGLSCEAAYIPYTPSITACGHTCVYTGSVPAIHGIVGNNWFNYDTQQEEYCVEDKTVIGVGTTNQKNGKMSPKNMQTTTITDALRINENFKNKVIGIAIKDRGAILPAGHSATAAYWYDNKSGNFISSSYYMNSLPNWVEQFNARKMVDSLYQKNWTLSAPEALYNQYCTADKVFYEAVPFGKTQLNFPYQLKEFSGKDYTKIAYTPYGNSLTIAMAKAAIEAEKMGKNNTTDFLAISFSSPDYIGHQFGPNSWEILDNYLKLDADLGSFFTYLDQQIGKDNYLVFLTADHAVAAIPEFLQENKIPAGRIFEDSLTNKWNKNLANIYGYHSLVKGVYNYQIVLNEPLITTKNLDKQAIIQTLLKALENEAEVAFAYPAHQLYQAILPPPLKTMLENSYYPKRYGAIQIILKPNYMESYFKNQGTTHGAWNAYDTHIPLVWYGKGIKKGKLYRQVFMNDITPTLAALLQIEPPNGTTGKIITEILEK